MQTTRSVQLNTGATLQYAIGGADSGTPLLLLHGMGLSMRQYFPNIVELEQTRQTVSVTLRGHAGSAVSIAGQRLAWSVRLLAADVAALMQRLGLRRVHLLGQSLGALVALELLRRIPAATASLIICETPVAQSETRLRTRLRSLANRLLGPGSKLAQRLNGTNSANRFVRAFTKQLGDEAPRQHIARLAGCLGRYDYTDVVQQRRTPILALRGEQAAGQGTAEELGIPDDLPHVEAMEISGAYRLLNLERPQEFNRVVAHFISQVDA